MSVPHVSVDPDVIGGQPCFEGTRTPVDVLFVNLAAGERLDAILHSFPAITREAAVSVLREACRLVRERALDDSAPGSDLRAAVGPLMYPRDWDQISTDERAEHYRGRSRD